MAVTRSKAAHQAFLASLNPQSIEAFKEGVGSVLRQWTALELAVFHQWGGPTSKERAEALRMEIVNMFLGPEKVYKDDISLVLEDYLETEFSTICEDESPDELGELFCTMWRQCLEGNYQMVTDILAKEYVRHEMVTRSQGLDGGGDADDHSDDGRDDSELKQEVNEAVMQHTMTEDGMMVEEGNNPNDDAMVEPGPDPEGWEVVNRSKKRKGKSYKI